MTDTSRVDVTKKQIKGMNLGDTVTITQVGKVTELTDEHSFDEGVPVSGKKEKSTVFPPQITIEVSSTKVRSNSNQFDQLAGDNDG